MTQQRAYSLIKVKSVNEERREITGIASTPTPDRSLDIVEPGGFNSHSPCHFCGNTGIANRSGK